MERLKVGLVLDDSIDRGDGVQQYVTTLGSWLEEQQHEVHYLVGQSTARNERTHSLARNMHVRFNANRLSMPLPSAGADIRRLVLDQRFDVLHVQMPFSPFMASKVVRNARPETAVVGTFHILPRGRLQQVGSRALGLAQKKTLARFDAVCSVSQPAADFAKAYFGVESEVIPCMINTAKWQTETKQHPQRVVFLGRLVERKGCRELLESLALLSPKLRDGLEVIIAGDGPQKSALQRLAKDRGIDANFLGYIAEEQKAPLLASAEIAVFPALGGESFGIVLLEAMAAGAGAVMGGNNPGYMSVIGRWPEAVIDPQDPQHFSAQLSSMLTDKQLRAHLHLQQQDTIRQYDVGAVGPRIVEMYTNALLHRRQDMR